MITLNCINLHASSAMPPSKLSLLRAAATKGDWTCALSIAAKFPQLGAHKAAITRAHGAIQNPTDPRYQDFLGRAAPAEVLGTQRRVASLADLFQGKLWAAADPLSLWCWRRLGRPDCFSFRRLIRQWRLIRLIRRRRGSRPGQL
jgi:hypothetical protein